MTIDAIRYDASISDRRAPGRAVRVERRVPGRGWVGVNPNRTLRLKAGSELKLRVTMRHADGGHVKLPFDIDVPRRPLHAGFLAARGGGVLDAALNRAEDLDELPRAARRSSSDDDLIVSLVLRTGDDPVVREHRARGKNVIVGARTIQVQIRRR